MSLDATRWAWSLSDLRALEKLVLLSLADRADEKHRCYPSYQRICDDTCADRKTVSIAINSLVKKNVILRTGDYVGKTKSTPVYELIGVPCRVLSGTKNGTSTKNGTGSDPKNGTTKQSQKRDTESTIIEPTNEPNEKILKNPNIGTHEQNIEIDSQTKKPKRNTRSDKQKFAQRIKELWHVAVVEHGIKKTSRGIGVTGTDINNIQRIIKYAKDDGSAMDYSSLDTWPNYFNELFLICKRKDFLQKCIKGFSWAVKPNTYQKLADDTYLNLEEVA